MKHLKKFNSFRLNEGLRAWQEEQVNEILDRMSKPDYETNDSDKAILDNFRHENRDIEDIVNRIKELREIHGQLAAKEHSRVKAQDATKELETGKAFLTELGPINSELYGLQDDLIDLYKIENPMDVGLYHYDD